MRGLNQDAKYHAPAVSASASNKERVKLFMDEFSLGWVASK